MTDTTAREPTPYKYLDHYTLEDHAIFHGREREIRALTTDVIVSRLVVLFAETGTGKTSLINAGVRPRLENWRDGTRPPPHERKFATFHVRVNQDPARSIRAELKELAPIADLPDDAPLAPALTEAMRMLGRPIALFLDQFEEFFLYRDADRPEHRKHFINEVAALYRNQESGVHLVFSLREEFLGKMDAFRERIPTIFHKDSQLRLAWFSADQAKEAITRPASAFGVEIEDTLVSAILADLLTHDGVEPAQLQIVCDSLWRIRGSDRVLTREHYRRIAELRDEVELADMGVLEDSFAKRVLGRRFEADLSGLTDRPALDTLAALLPELCTRERTKRIRDMPGLASVPDIDPDSLPQVANYLTESRLTQQYERDGVRYLELSHDYLVERMPALVRRVRTLRARRILARSMEAYRKRGVLPLPEALEEIGEQAPMLAVNAEQARTLFLAALEWEHDAARWFHVADELGVPVWELMADTFEVNDRARDPVAQTVMSLVASVRSEQALALLVSALDRPHLAPAAIDALGTMRTLPAVQQLWRVATEGPYRAEAMAALRSIARSRSEAAPAASSALEAIDALDVTESNRASDNEFTGTGLSAPPRRPAGFRWTDGTAAPEAAWRDSRPMPAPPLDYLANAFKDGTLVPFLGAGANTAARPPGVRWEHGAPFMPSGGELALHLASIVDYPAVHGMDVDLVQVASYFAEILGRGALNDELRGVFGIAQAPAPIHRFLAQLRPLLILTTNFDTVLETAFDEADRPYQVVTNASDRTDLRGAVLTWRSDDPTPQVVSPSQLVVDLAETTVIYKVAGSFNPWSAQFDSFIATEEDYVDLVSSIVQGGSVPAIFARAIRSRPTLFLGLTLDRWYMRALFHGMWPRGRQSRAWAITRNPSLITAHLWEIRGVKVHDMSIEDLLHGLPRERT